MQTSTTEEHLNQLSMWDLTACSFSWNQKVNLDFQANTRKNYLPAAKWTNKLQKVAPSAEPVPRKWLDGAQFITFYSILAESNSKSSNTAYCSNQDRQDPRSMQNTENTNYTNVGNSQLKVHGSHLNLTDREGLPKNSAKAWCRDGAASCAHKAEDLGKERDRGTFSS